MPVVQALLREEEVERVALTFDAPDVPQEWSAPVKTDPGSVWLTLVAVGELFEHMLVWSTKDREQAIDLDDSEEALEYNPSEDNADFMADTLYDQLCDWVVETRFSWGEQRSGSYVVLPPHGAPDKNAAPEGQASAR